MELVLRLVIWGWGEKERKGKRFEDKWDMGDQVFCGVACNYSFAIWWMFQVRDVPVSTVLLTEVG